MTLSEKIQELSEIWGKCCAGYHKSNDVVHEIIQKYQFGNIEYICYHNAYIGDDISESFNTIRAAQEYLCRELIRQIEKRINFEVSRCNDPSDESEKPLDYWLSLQKTFESARNIECSDSPAQINYEELYLRIRQEYEVQNYQMGLINKILDNHNIQKYDENYPELKYSTNYRVGILVEKLKNEK